MTLSAASGLTVTVAYSTTDLTASAADYDTASGILTFTPGSLTHSFSVDILGDMIAETDEQVTLALGEPANAGLGTPAGADHD